MGMGARGLAISVLALQTLLGNRMGISALDNVVAQFQHDQAPAAFAIDVEAKPFEETRGLERSLYDTAGEVHGTTVYGRGQRLIITIKNETARRVDIARLLLRLIRLDKTPGPRLRYDKLTTSLPHTRLPIEELDEQVRWIDTDDVGSEKTLGEGWIRLGPAGSDDDTHQVGVDVEATAPGLWEYVVEAEYDSGLGQRARSTVPQPLSILLRGR
jgi:hypothetical protein